MAKGDKRIAVLRELEETFHPDYYSTINAIEAVINRTLTIGQEKIDRSSVKSYLTYIISIKALSENAHKHYSEMKKVDQKPKPITEAVTEVKYDASLGLQLAWMYVEFGFKAAEKGWNLEATRVEFNNLMKKTLP